MPIAISTLLNISERKIAQFDRTDFLFLDFNHLLTKEAGITTIEDLLLIPGQVTAAAPSDPQGFSSLNLNNED